MEPIEKKTAVEEHTTSETHDVPKKRNFDFLLIIGFLGAWFMLQAWVLPGMGVST